MGFIKWIWHLFIPRERTLVYTTFDQAQYFKAKSSLAAAGIGHRSKIDGGMRGQTRRAPVGGRPQVQHSLYVREEDEHKALNAIR